MTYVRDIVILGSGNVATHLARALAPRLQAIVSRNADHAMSLAVEVAPDGCILSGTLSMLGNLEPAIVIVSVADNALPSMATRIGELKGHPLTLHTSGTIAKEVLLPMSSRVGVLYPLQTFSRNKAVDMRQVPFFTEATSDEDLFAADTLARSISDKVQHADVNRRRRLHIAGVFASNFPNILYEITGEILTDAGYDLNTVRPLVEAMTAKAFEIGPHAAQTGPARRGDIEVMHSHMAQLPPAQAEIYHVLSQYIIDAHKEKKDE